MAFRVESNQIDNTKVEEHERLIRRVLSLPKRPAMIMMQVWKEGRRCGSKGRYRYGRDVTGT